MYNIDTIDTIITVFQDLYPNITLGHHTDLASLVSTYTPPGNIFWYRLKSKLILH